MIRSYYQKISFSPDCRHLKRLCKKANQKTLVELIIRETAGGTYFNRVIAAAGAPTGSKDLLVQSDGNKLKIESIERKHETATVYNMTVDEFHTYFGSDLGIWVHNTDESCLFGASGVQVTGKTL
ncbi:polymorphic toxin-type HINT domain-containing protein [Cohnella sp. GCM10020058]|uniref:polymorphic toxin-type HINT domain-containing protein n=1 Tax=Cohnella sp. GCM10020058 TaxID=3317330 RepID=UPI0036298786